LVLAETGSDGLYFDIDRMKWRDSSGICHTCTAGNGFPIPVIKDGFYFDPNDKKWHGPDSGDICHTCTPRNGFPTPQIPEITPDIRTLERVCHNPNSPCTIDGWSFQANDLTFSYTALERMSRHYSRPFYAILLKSIKVKIVDDPTKDCGSGISEKKRLATQKLFPRRKVFTSTFGCLGAGVWYSNTNNKYDFLAVYAGETMREAKKVLKKVKATGRFKRANIRSMQVVVDTTH